jgi:hypothetical protein
MLAFSVANLRPQYVIYTLAQRGSLFIFDLGYFTIHAFALISQAGAYFLSRLNHQTNLYDGTTPGRAPLD